jgi:dTDP-4-dehydrorhamnose 3,5-epimerase
MSPRIFQDGRGFFFESYRQPVYAEQGIECSFPQDNFSFSDLNTVRGLHYQSEPGQAKLVSCIQGEIWDVVVDIRPESPTFKKWQAFRLDDRLRQQLYIPVGFAHGFCVLSETALVHYKVSHIYNAKTECSIRWNDPDLAIPWPTQEPILSDRDQKSPFFKEVFHVVDRRC